MNPKYLFTSASLVLLGSACASDPAGSGGAASTGGAGGADMSTSSASGRDRPRLPVR
jgi:hypothetical protein